MSGESFAEGPRGLLRKCIRTARDAGLAPVLTVLRPSDSLTRLGLEGLACRVVRRADLDGGMRASLGAARTQLPSDVAAAIVLLPDMPAVDSTMVRRLLAAYDGGIVASRYGAFVAPPVLFPRDRFGELANAGDGFGAQLRRRDDVTLVSMPEEAGLDVDVPADYRRIRRPGDGPDTASGPGPGP